MLDKYLKMESFMKDYIQKLVDLIELGIDVYDKTRFDTTNYLADFRREYLNLKEDELLEKEERVAGRIYSIRRHGKIIFADIRDGVDKLQIVARKDFTDETSFKAMKVLTRGDIVGVVGYPYKTKRGELSILLKKLEVLSLALRPIPDSWFGLKDIEERYRQRYLDFIINEKSRKNVSLVFEIEGILEIT